MSTRFLPIVLSLLLASSPLVLAATKCPAQGVTVDEALLHATDTLINAYYNSTTGLFATGWWNSASILYGLAVGARLQPSVNATRVLSLLSNTYALNKAGFVNGHAGTEAWWGLCWVAAANLAFKMDQRDLGTSFLELAMRLGANAGQQVTNDGCELVPPDNGNDPEAFFSLAYASVAGQLVLRTGDVNQAIVLSDVGKSMYSLNRLKSPLRAYLNRSKYCDTTYGPLWTSNEGLFLSALTDQDLLLGDFQKLLIAASRSTKSMSSFSRDGILVESCEPHCNSNQTQYKGIYVRSVVYLWNALCGWGRSLGGDEHPSMSFVNDTLASMRAFVVKNAESVLRRSCQVLPIDLPGGHTAEGWFFGQDWSGPFDAAGAGRQSSVFELLLAAAVTSRCG